MRRRDFMGMSLAAGSVLISKPVDARHTLQHHIINLENFIRFRFCSGKPFRRRNVYTLLNANANDSIVASYAAGITAMKALPNTNPNNWDYQANIHGFRNGTHPGPLPNIFTTCEHGNPHFLPWHRLYLFFFESIVRQRSGNPNFALPYWNYELPGQAALPAPFRQAGSVLRDSTRNSSLNNGGNLSTSTVSSATAMLRTSFLGAGQFCGSLESSPHDNVHIAIGGNMGGFSGAGRDPIFWLHHCNIDRLWEKWLAQGNRSNPTTDPGWMNETSTFADVGGSFVTLKNSDVLNVVSQLNYQYDDPSVCIPLLIARNFPPTIFRVNAIKMSAVENSVLGERIAEKLRPDLKSDRIDLSTVGLAGNERLKQIVNPDRLSTLSSNNERVLLVFSGIRTEVPLGGVYEVYVDLPEDGKPSLDSPHFVGTLSTFGADRESRELMKSSGKHAHIDGVERVIDITEQLQDLGARSRLFKNSVKVTLVRAGVQGDDGRATSFDEKAALEIDAIELHVVPGPVEDR